MKSSAAAIVVGLAALLGQDPRPGLFLREDWKESAAATPVTQEHVANPDLLLTRHGPAQGRIKKSHHDTPADDPYYVWSGDADGNWAVSLRHRSACVDLAGQARVRWRAKQSGFRQLRILLKTADGAWLVSDQADGESPDWRVREFDLAAVRWRSLDIERVTEGGWAKAPDLTRGGGTPASSRLDWIEVYGLRSSCK